MASKNKIGCAIRRLFGYPPLRAVKESDGTSRYYYLRLRLYAPGEGEEFENHLILHRPIELRFEHELLNFEVPRELCHDGRRQMVNACFQRFNQTYGIDVDGEEVNMAQLGLTGKHKLNQRFVNGFHRLALKLKLCEGSSTDFSQMKGLKSSIPQAREMSMFSQNASGATLKKTRYFSKRCSKVLAITAEIDTTICSTCSKDLKQVEVNFAKKALYDEAAAQVLAGDTNLMSDLMGDGVNCEAGAVGGVSDDQTGQVSADTSVDLDDTVSTFPYIDLELFMYVNLMYIALCKSLVYE